MKGNKKGQAALEYLMTYGWAILVIVIVLGILLLLFTNMSRVEKCLVTPQGFTCGNANPIVSVDSNKNVNIAFRLQNGLSGSVIIDHMLCIQGSEPASVSGFTVSKPASTEAGTVLPGSSYEDTIPCLKTDGTKLTSNANQPFTGVVLVYYKLDNDIGGTDIFRKAIMSISTTVSG
ncbi:MAG: hypothetical protein NTY68_03875 [Candidatus Micrarchaeota archaeon]|nr:hypothetical protein [Candidatus Micrarchaeota archaeon]